MKKRTEKKLIGQIEPVYTTINTRNSKFIGFHKNAASVTIISRININIKQKNIAQNVYSKNEDLIRVSKKKKDKYIYIYIYANSIAKKNQIYEIRFVSI